MNNEKYTPLKKKIYISLIFLSIFYIFGCASKDTSSSIIPPAPIKTESPLPNIGKIKVDIDNTIDNNTKIEYKINDNSKTVLDQKVSILEALAQAEKIKQKALSKIAISELEAITLIKELKKVEARNLFLEQQNGELSEYNKEQQKILKVIKDTLQKTEIQITNKDEETRQLREQHVYLTSNLILKNNEFENSKIQLQKEKQISASALVYKNWIIAIVVGFILWTIIKNIIMIYSPIKFRI